jgi:hypothetical protein
MVGFGKNMNVYLYPYLVKRVNDGLLPLPLLRLFFCIIYIPLPILKFLKTLYTFYLVVDIYVFEFFYIAFAFPKTRDGTKTLGWWMLNC